MTSSQRWVAARERFREAIKPEIDDTLKTGLGLIDLLFGLALGLAFAQTLNGYGKISAAGWGQLILAVVTIVLSWVGYHNSRQRGLWMLKFVNRPLVQYLVDFLIIAAYWALVVTAEGIPPVAGASTAAALNQPSAAPESLLLLVIFVLYFVWDLLEIGINENDRYRKTRDASLENDDLSANVRVHAGDRSRQRMTALFLAILGLVYAGVLGTDPTDSVTVAVIDVILGALLVVYRLAQTWAATPATQARTGSGGGG